MKMNILSSIGGNTTNIFLSSEEELLKEIKFVNECNGRIKEREYENCNIITIIFAGKIKTEKIYCEIEKRLLFV